MPSPLPTMAYRFWALALCSAGTLSGGTALLAADRGNMANPQVIYQKDRAACVSDQSGQDRATCLREAAAALQEARRGRLDDGEGQFEKNRLLRCDRLPPEDRAECVRRMNGEGTTSGSVKSGGIYRELATPVSPPPGN